MDENEARLTRVKAGPYSIRGISVGGVYTSLSVPELSVVLDAGITLRGLCATDHVFLSHGHIDHVGGLFGLLGVRGMMRKPEPPRVYMPKEIATNLTAALATTSRLQRFPSRSTRFRWSRATAFRSPTTSGRGRFGRTIRSRRSAFNSCVA